MNIRLGLISCYSLLYGVRRHGELLDRAASFGVKTVSFCDLDNLYGVHTFLQEAKERGIKPVIGAALTINRKRIANNKREEVFCFVENRTGFSRLCELLTLRNRDKKKFNPLPYLRENSSGLVLASNDDFALETLYGHVKRLFAAITPDNCNAVNISRKFNVPLAFIDNSLFLDKGDFAVHRVLRAIDLLKTTGNLSDGDTADNRRILRPSMELHRRLVSWPQAAKGTQEIADLCTYDNLFHGWVFPAYDTGELSNAGELRRRVFEGNAARYGELTGREIERIEYELGIIEEKGFSSYFLLIDDIVKMASRTCGRGSGAASIVSYGLGITNVDPLRHNLYFERFLNAARPDPPDLDIDFAWDERDDLIKAVIEKFGYDYCARVANHNFFRYRSALRETAKAYGFGDAEITEVEKKLAMKNDDFEIKEDKLWKEIFSIAAKIEGLPRGLGMHCGGIVITPEPVYRYAPVEKSAEGYPLLAWEKEGSQAAGFVKIDLLGNRSLAVIRDVLMNLEEQGIVIDRDVWKPIDDKQTIESLRKGGSIGVFYIESPAMRQLQKKADTGDFEHIVIHSSIIRPAANKFITEYVRRLKGGKWEPLHPRLEKILDETYGILCYQEDVSKTAAALAGFSETDADNLRKIIAKNSGGARLDVYRNKFFGGCLKNGVSEKTILKIWEMMLSFDGYSFCKPHSASYAMVSFQSAYLRVHHPAEFMAAVLSNQGGFYQSHAYISEARRMQLFVAGPDVNVSLWHYYGKERDLIIGFMAIKGLSLSGAKAILAERERGGKFLSLDDYARRMRLSRDDIAALCRAGVFDSIADGLSRPLQTRRLLSANTGTAKKGQNELFTAEVSLGLPEMQKSVTVLQEDIVCKPENDLLAEYRALGFLRNHHPLVLWKLEVLAVKNRVKALHIENYTGQHIKMIGWPVAKKDVWAKDGLPMCFLSLEDETGLYETVVFPQIYDRYSNLLFDWQPLLVYGKVENDQGAVSLEVRRIEVLKKVNGG